MGNATEILTPDILSAVLLRASLRGAFAAARDSNVKLVLPKIRSSVCYLNTAQDISSNSSVREFKSRQKFVNVRCREIEKSDSVEDFP
jgi:hypothetical protein